MSRLAWILVVLILVLVGIGWWFLVWDPTAEDIDQVRAETELTRTQTQQERAIEAQLRRVREQAPEIEAELTDAEVLIPSEPWLPPLFSQIQQASDEAGVQLLTLSPGRPVPVADAPGGLVGIQVNFSVEGSYFQLVDLARRLEDPAINARGLTWRSATFSPSEFPTLQASLAAEVYARSGEQETEVPAEEAAPEGEDATDPDAEPREDPDEDTEEAL